MVHEREARLDDFATRLNYFNGIMVHQPMCYGLFHTIRGAFYHLTLLGRGKVVLKLTFKMSDFNPMRQTESFAWSDLFLFVSRVTSHSNQR